MFIQIVFIILGIVMALLGAYSLGADNRLNQINDVAYGAYANDLSLTFWKTKPETGVKFIPKPKE